MKRILILSLVFLLMLSLAACGSKGSGAGKDHAGPEEIPAPLQEPSGKEDDPEQVSEKETVDAEDISAQSPENSKNEAADASSEKPENSDIKTMIGDTAVPVTWEQNESAEALRQLVREKPLTIQMSMYGGFEQVGSIGQGLPRNDVQTATGAGDIVLYSGDQLVVFYGSNSWAYTRLGHIDLTQQEISDLLSHEDVTITLE